MLNLSLAVLGVAAKLQFPTALLSRKIIHSLYQPGTCSANEQVFINDWAASLNIS